MARKFNCTFSISTIVEKTYIITNLPIQTDNDINFVEFVKTPKEIEN